jgi:hypothetical protein
VRANGVVLRDEVVEDELLGGEVGAGREGSTSLEGEVEALVAAVEVGTTREDELRADAKADPPNVKAGEAADGLGGEGGAVIGADGIGQSELTKDSLKDRLSEAVLGGGEALAGEAEAGEAVKDGEGETVVAIEGLELALEVGGPYSVGARRQGRAEARVAWVAAATAARQAVASQDLASRACGGQWEVRPLPAQIV